MFIFLFIIFKEHVLCTIVALSNEDEGTVWIDRGTHTIYWELYSFICHKDFYWRTCTVSIANPPADSIYFIKHLSRLFIWMFSWKVSDPSVYHSEQRRQTAEIITNRKLFSVDESVFFCRPLFVILIHGNMGWVYVSDKISSILQS